MTTGFAIVDGSLDPVTHVVEPSGEVDLASAAELEACLDALFDSGTRRIIVDLGEVSFMDSTGVRALVRARTRLNAAGGILLVVCPHPNLHRVFEVTGVVDLLNVVASRRDAIGSTEAGVRVAQARSDR